MESFKLFSIVGLITHLLNIHGFSACMAEDKTYVVNYHAHVQSEIQEALISISTGMRGANLANEYVANDGENAEYAATRSYLGTIFEEINEDLFKYKVQINLVFDPLEIDQLNIMGSTDPSCELEDALKSRTQLAMNNLIEKYNNFVGNHLFLFACITSQEKFEPVEVIKKGACGRIAGIMWKNSNETKQYIKSAIMESLTSTPGINDPAAVSEAIKNRMCKYCEDCLSTSPSTIGQIFDYVTQITFTQDGEINQNTIQDTI